MAKRSPVDLSDYELSDLGGLSDPSTLRPELPSFSREVPHE